MNVTFSNPRTRAEIQDYPLGGNKRGLCVFQVQRNPNFGWRVARTTTGKPKLSTYSGPTVIVDGSNGKTYILQHVRQYGFVNVMRYDFMDAASDIGRNSAGVFKEADTDLYNQLVALIDQGGAKLL